jgi:hypothetical protein
MGATMHGATPAHGPVYGTSWRRHGARRQRAARVARLLRPAAHVLGGLVSNELTVPFRGCWYRPDVGVVFGPDVPLDGVLARGPSLVVRLGGPLSAREWLDTGARTVWTVDDGGAVSQLTGIRLRHLAAHEWLEHPDEPALRLPAAELTGRAAASAPARRRIPA